MSLMSGKVAYYPPFSEFSLRKLPLAPGRPRDMPSRILSGAELPWRLADLPRRPGELYLQGELPRGPAVAIVGTRYPTPRARAFARTLAADLGRAGVAILSGGAKGIDTAAHEGALDAGARTVVVAPAGFLVAYPAMNRVLFSRVVASGGAYVSHVPDGMRATRGAFFRRNASLAALAHALVVVEADFQSGARNAASWARRLGRPVLAVPYAPWQEQGRGCLLELRAGAQVCRDAADVLEQLDGRLTGPGLPISGSEPPEQALLPFAADPPEARIRAAVARGARTPDEIGEALGLDAAEVQRHVLTLTLEGVLAPDAAGALTLASQHASVSARKHLK